MSAVIVYRFMGGVMFPCRNEAQTRGRVMRGFTAIGKNWRKNYKFDFRARRSNTEGVQITVQPVVYRGVDYRGLAVDRKYLQLHNGWIDKLGKWVDLFPTDLGLGQIEMHENCHILGLNHSPDENDLMHSNAPPTLTTTLPWMRLKFGAIKPKSNREASEIERVLRAVKDVEPCYTGRVEY